MAKRPPDLWTNPKPPDKQSQQKELKQPAENNSAGKDKSLLLFLVVGSDQETNDYKGQVEEDR